MGLMRLRFALHACLFSVFLIFSSGSAILAQTVNPFFTPPIIPAGTGQVASADVNGDGKPDLIFFDGTILLGNGDGTFTKGTSWIPPLNLGVAQFAIADFNGDAKPDIFVAGPFSQFSVFLGNGDGTFQAAMTTKISQASADFVVGDLNGDGKADVVALVGTTYLTYLGKGNGTFATGITSNVINTPSSHVLADFNADGKLDMFDSSEGVQLGNGDGTFQAIQQFPSGALPGTQVVGDFDGDGRLDVAAVGGSSASPQVQVLFGNGDGTFHAATIQSLPANTAILNPVAGDLNGDGKADLVASTNLSVQLLASKGDGTFAPGNFYNAPSGGGANIVIADFNGDKKRDIAAFKTMLLGNGDGTLQGNEANPNLTIPANILGSAVTGDFNGDGHPDIATLVLNGNTYNADIWLNDGSANFTLAHTYTIPSTPSGVITVVANLLAATDVNGDGKIDLVAANMEDNLTLVVFPGNGDGSFGAPLTTSVSNSGKFASVMGIAFGDLNGDGKIDVLITGFVNPPNEQSGNFFVLLGNGDGTFGAPNSPNVSFPTGRVFVGDFNKDGKLDAALDTSNGIGVLLGNGDGTFQATTFIPNTTGLVADADLNGDGKLDLLTSSGSSYQVLTGSGDGTFTAQPKVPTSPNFTILQLADFNRDGHLDAWGIFSSPNFGLAFGSGNAMFNSPLVLPVLGSANGTSLIADFNGDGKPDVAILTPSQTIWLFNGAGHAVPDFSITTKSGGSATVSAGGAADYTLSVTGTGGFVGTVALTCSGAPAGALCNLSPNSVGVVGSVVQSVDVTVATTAASRMFPTSDFSGRDDHGRRLLVPLSLFVAMVSIAGWLARAPRRRFFVVSAAMTFTVLLLFTGVTMSGCGGGSNSGGGGMTGTPAGTYNITITGSQSGAASHTVKLTLVVQ